ncbi:MAG: glycosyltransferase family 4 protein [Candidatus Latescibacteria bacterium]|nr:glycosyltransferase family 4 protein [Candidatus Latescibacterota bacterium]
MSDSGVVLLVSSDFPPVPGGQSRYLYDLWSCLPSAQVVVLAPALPGAAAFDAGLGCRVVRVWLPLGVGLGSKLLKPFVLLWQVWRLCRRLRVRALHCGQVFSAGFAGYWCRRWLGVPYVLYVYGADLLEFRDRPGWGWLLRAILDRAERVVAISRFTAEAVAAAGVEPERLALVTPAIDLERFVGMPARTEERRRRGWEGRLVILSVGRLVERKGQDMVIRALPAVAARLPEVYYAIGGSGPFRAELEALAAELGVAERVGFLGFVPEAELPGLYGAADLFAMPSRELPNAGDVEGFGIVFIEANAAGLAVLGGRSGGVGDAVEDEVTGLLVDPDDPAAVAAGLIRLLEDGEWRARLAARGGERARAGFDRRDRARLLWELGP